MEMNDRRLTELDGLRGIAALAVVIFHYLYHYNSIYGHSFEVSEIFRFGYYGVHLFFIVSGFVIYWTISRSNNALDFLWSRFSRLYPPFWVAITLTFLIVFIFSLPGREVNFMTYLSNITMIHEYLGYEHVDGVYWTLTLELAFYFWIFVILSIGQIRNIEKILLFWICMSSVITFHKFNIMIDPRLKKFLILDYIELFTAGICFYKYKTKSYSFITHILLFTTVVALYTSYSTKIATALCGLYFIFWLIINNKAKLLSNGLLVYLGTISYSLYLIHQNIGYVIIRQFYLNDLNPLFGIFTAVVISLIASHLIMNYVERPSLKYLKSFYQNNARVQKLKNKLGFSSAN